MRRGLGLLHVVALAAAGCGDLDVGDETTEIRGVNKIALNKIALNKIALNKIALNSLGINKIALNKIALNKIALNEADLNKVALNKIALNQVILTAAGDDWYSSVYREVQVDGEWVLDSESLENDEGAALSEAGPEDLVNIFDKTVRCINEPGNPATITVRGVTTQTADGMFGLGARDLTYGEFISAYMSCMAVWANDEAALINVTADLPDGDGVVVTADEWNAGFQVPGISVAFKVDVIDHGRTDGYVEIEGRWLWNASRHQSWMTYPRSFTAEMSWFAAYGRAIDTNRTCLEALRGRQEMPSVCGGDDSEVWNGRLLGSLSVGTGTSPSRVLCGDDLWEDQRGQGIWYLDSKKGVLCGETGPSADELPAIFYADLQPGVDLEDVLWWSHQMNFIGQKSSSGGSGSGSGSGS